MIESFINNNSVTTTINILDIVEGTSVDGPGLRTSIYVAGCKHFCHNCHNPQSWKFCAGKPMTIDEIINIIRYNDFDVSLSGGDPLYQPDKMVELCRKIKTELKKNIWCYTGFTWEEIINNKGFDELLKWIDVIVDGRYEDNLKDKSLLFRGSSNQRIIDVRQSLQTESPIPLII